MISNAWNQAFPNCLQSALASTLSDHSPIQCICSTKFSLPNTFKFENFWLKLADFTDTMKQTWAKDDIAKNPQEPHQKFIKLRKTIRYWERDKVGNLVKQKKACNKIFQWMDRSSERRPLTQLCVLNKAPGPYVFSFLFYQSCWEFIHFSF
jgi:hypothetical protein